MPGKMTGDRRYSSVSSLLISICGVPSGKLGGSFLFFFPYFPAFLSLLSCFVQK